MANFEIKNDYLLMTPSRAYSFEYYKAAIHDGVALCEQHQLTKLLADARTLDINIPVLDRFKLGVEMADTLGNTIKFAILVPAEIIDKMGENAAVNRGGRVFVTSSLEQALKWLDVK